jgi:hypothetical protein
LPNSDSIILRCVLSSFDQDSINQAVGQFITLPVKIFVNCKSSKRIQQKKIMDPKEYEQRRKAILRDSTFQTTDLEVRQIIETEDKLENLEVSTIAEVQYPGKENIEGFVQLVNMFLRTMLITSTKPCLININDQESLECESESQIFYYSCLEFKNKFTNLLGDQIEQLKTISVVTSYNRLPDQEINT